MEVSSAPMRSVDDIKKPSNATWDPIKDSPHHSGQNMPFWFVTGAL